LTPLLPRRLITFGVIKGLIYRIYKYPILFNLNTASAISAGSMPSNVINQNTGNAIPPRLLAFLDGHHHYDEICTELRCSPKELDEQLGYNSEANQEIKPAGPGDNEAAAVSRSLDSRDVHGDVVNNGNGNSDAWIVQFIFR